MKILIVITDYFNPSNGLSISTQRFVAAFRERGHEVRILTGDTENRADYPVPVKKIPVFDKVITEQGFQFAKTDTPLMEEAVKWADIVHIEDPFSLCWKTAKIARDRQKPVTGTFHLYPENMTASVPRFNKRISNESLMRLFRDIGYSSCTAIQCPTEKVKTRLLQNNFSARLYTISNGISSEYLEEPVEIQKGPYFQILSIGRFSREKDQKTLIQAVGLSKYAAEIRLVLAGKGPLAQEYRDLCRELPNPCLLKFCTPRELKELMGGSSLYVHTATVEVEGMACMEAFAYGCVPVIANSDLSSTMSYGLTDLNLFPVGDSLALAKRIDYWYEHPEELAKMRQTYRAYARDLSVDHSADQVLNMFEEAIAENEESIAENL